MKRVSSRKRNPSGAAPFTPAVKAKGFIFTSGQIPLDSKTKKIVRGDIKKQTERVLENLRNTLEAEGSSLDRVVKATVFLVDMRDLQGMNEVYARYFPATPPARSTVQVARLVKDVRVEIELVALS